jgi:DNA polymerase V
MIGLVDCNNFFASCERVFHPELRTKPVVVLSNNDGCVIARSNEAKALGIKMGIPFYQVKNFVDEGKLHVFSSNYTLYDDMSKRVMSVIRGMVPRIEVYSIDETFIDVSGVENIYQLGLQLSARVEKWTGIPVSVGLAENKTLAKMASKFAKKYKGYHGCCVIDTPERCEKALRLFPINDVWGIGRRMIKQMNYYGVHTAYDFTKWNRSRVQREFGVTGVSTWLELQGVRCIDFEPLVAKKSITTSRSFREEITDFESLSAMVADFAALCAKKLREQHGRTAEVVVYFRTNTFRTDQPQYSNVANVELTVPSSDVRELVAAATAGLKSIFRKGYAYKQAGVVVTNIVNGVIPIDLFDPVDRVRQEKLLQTLDKLRGKMGDRMVRVASQGDCSGEINRKYRSHCYTTNPKEIIEVKIT